MIATSCLRFALSSIAALRGKVLETSGRGNQLRALVSIFRLASGSIALAAHATAANNVHLAHALLGTVTASLK